MRVDFDPIEHRYFVNRKEYPSVSRILQDEGWSDYSALDSKPPRDPRFNSRGEEVSYRGHWVHHACALLARGRLRWSSLQSSPQWAGYVQSFKLWKDQSAIVVLLVENIVFNPVDGYCGTIDLLVIYMDWFVVIDLKTGEKEPWHRLQTAFYRQGLPYLPEDLYPWRGKPHRRATLHLKEDGSPARLEWMDDVRDLAWARAIAASWYARGALYGR